MSSPYSPSVALFKKTAVTDPFFANVVLLALNENGANGTTVFVDKSNSAHTLTTTGNAVWSNTTAPTGMTTSMACDGTAPFDYLDIAEGADFEFGSGNFVIEAWVRSHVQTQYKSAFGKWVDVPDEWILGISQTGTKFGFLWGPFSNANALVQDPNAFSIDTWYALTIVRSGNNFYLFRDGTQVATAVSATSQTANAAAKEQIGAYNNGAGGPWNGYLGPIRVTKGTDRNYTGATYTVPTLPLPTS